MIRDAYRMHTRLTWLLLAVSVTALVLAAVALSQRRQGQPAASDQRKRRRTCNCGE